MLIFLQFFYTDLYTIWFLPYFRIYSEAELRNTVLTMAQEDYDFSHRKGSLNFSVEKVEMEFEDTETRAGSFTIEGENGMPVSGFIYTTDARMQCTDKTFRGVEAEIHYTFNPDGMEPGDVFRGNFVILSDKGEYLLPYEVIKERNYMYSSMGQIKNLFHFANLARTNWQEAVSLYYSNRFAEILTGNDKQYRCVYRGLSAEEGNEHCVEEFLITVHKKIRNTYELASQSAVFRSIPETLEKTLTLRVNGWGHVHAEVTKSGDFFKLLKRDYTIDDVADGNLEIGYVIHPEGLHAGRNFGIIHIKTPEGEFDFQVIVECNPIDMEHSANHIYKKTVAKLTREYIAFRLGKMNSAQWVQASSEELSSLTVKGEREAAVKLFEIQLLIAAGKDDEAGARMEKLEGELKNPETALSGPIYGYYLYLTSLLHPEQAYVDKVAHKVKKLFHKDPKSPILAWTLIYLREDLAFRDDKRWEFLEEQYHSGIVSPLLFTEAVHLLNKQPSLMVKLTDYERMLLRFALKSGAVTAQIGERVQFLISREKGYDDLLFDVLKKAYEISPSAELLQSICLLLMRGNKTGEEYLKWYEAAVKEDLRVTQLYEYYMASVPLGYKDMLPKMVMMYFAYQNHLEYDKMALLYANVFDYKTMVPEVADSYEETVWDFLREQIKRGRINQNLVKLYKRFVTPERLEDDLASSFAPLLFAHEVKIKRPNIKRVIIIHDKAVGEGKFAVYGDTSYPTIYSRDYSILLEDENGRRYVYDPMVKPTPVLYTRELRDILLPKVEGRAGILLNVCENDIGTEDVKESNVELYEKLLTSDSVTFTLKKEILFRLCKFYFEQDRIRELDRILMMAKPEVLPAEDRGEIIHILVARGFYEMAFDWLSRFGMEHVQEKTCMRLLSRYLERTDFASSDAMCGLSEELYKKGRYDQVLLRFLSTHFVGNTQEMLDLLHACEGFGVDTYALTERILIQMMYVGVTGPERENIYSRYVKNGGSTSIRKAYLSESSYGYFVGDYNPPESIFEEMERLIREGEELNRICKLSYAKHASVHLDPASLVKTGQGTIGETVSMKAIFLTEIVTEEIKNHVVFPFFLKFASFIPAVVPYTDRSFVEYRASAESRVIMHYAIEKENSENTEYRKEEMDNLYYGFFVKDFILFSGDTISYYITEETGNREQLTLSATLTKSENAAAEHAPWRFEMLDSAIKKREQGNDVACGDELREYAKLDFITKQLFKAEE